VALRYQNLLSLDFRDYTALKKLAVTFDVIIDDLVEILED
jgi:hypothetical protein